MDSVDSSGSRLLFPGESQQYTPSSWESLSGRWTVASLVLSRVRVEFYVIKGPEGLYLGENRCTSLSSEELGWLLTFHWSSSALCLEQ